MSSIILIISLGSISGEQLNSRKHIRQIFVGQVARHVLQVNVSLVNTENRSTTEFVREWTAVFDIRPLANNWGLENSKLMREQGQVNLKPVLSDFARRKWGVIWRLGNPTEKRAQILTGTGQNQFTKDTS